MEIQSLKTFFRAFLILSALVIIILLYRIYVKHIEKDELIESEFSARERRLRRRRRLESSGDRYWCLKTNNDENECKYMDFDKCERLGYETYLSESNCHNARDLLEEKLEDDVDEFIGSGNYSLY